MQWGGVSISLSKKVATHEIVETIYSGVVALVPKEQIFIVAEKYLCSYIKKVKGDILKEAFYCMVKNCGASDKEIYECYKN